MMSSGPRSGFLVSTFASVHGVRLAAAAWDSVTPEHVAEVIGALAAALVGQDLGAHVRVLDGAGIIGPARREGDVARLLEYRPPAIPAGLQQPEPVDEHDWSAPGGIGFLDLLRFVIGDFRHDSSCPLGSTVAAPG